MFGENFLGEPSIVLTFFYLGEVEDDKGYYEFEHVFVILDSTEVEGTLNVVSGLEWKDDLLNKGSSYFETVSFRIQHEVYSSYQ